jgi:hypothetical protein
MRRQRSSTEILSSTYINKTEFGIISGYKGRHLDRAYKLAVNKDQNDLNDRLIYTAGEKIRLTSACWVMGISLAQLQKIKADGLAHQSATD